MERKDGVSYNGLANDNSRKRMHYRVKKRPRWLDLLGLRATKEYVVKWRPRGLAALLIIGVSLALYLHNPSSQDLYSAGRNAVSSRKLLSTGNESHELPTWERCDFEKSHVPGAWLFSHIVCILIIFIAVAIICDDFFVPSLEVISEKLELSEDVAGATFMAAGSSAPELFTSVAGVAVETDVGVGTIVGSAVFNLLMIIALTAALAGQVLHLDWRPLMRDAFFYAMSIGCFIGFVWDGYFRHYEAVILLVLYCLYILLMVGNPRLMEWMGSWKCCCWNTAVSPTDEEAEAGDKSAEVTETNLNGSIGNVNHKERKPSLTGGHARRISIINRSMSGDLRDDEKHIFRHHQRGSIVGALGVTLPRRSVGMSPEEAIKEEEDIPPKNDDSQSEKGSEKEDTEEEEEETLQICPCLPCCPAIRTQAPSSDDSDTCAGCLKLFLRWVIFIPAFPFVCLFSWTIPDCSKDHNKKYYIVSFLMAVAWIAALSFGMVTLVGRVGCILNIDTYIMGLVVVAIGTSIPDALSSVLVARDGFGDMAVSNAIGSNVFDINLGLGLPFIIRIAIDKGAPIELLDAKEWVDYHDDTMKMVPHAKFGFILLFILSVALCVFAMARFRLNKYIGVSFVIFYVMFLAYAFLQELYCVRKLDIYC